MCWVYFYYIVHQYNKESERTLVISFVIVLWFWFGLGIVHYFLYSPTEPIKTMTNLDNVKVYPANSHSKIFHREDCKYVGKISDENYEVFFDKEEAKHDGYKPCKVCKP